MKIKKSVVPEVQGFYFVKQKRQTSWQLLVQIIGIAPFMGFETVHTLFKLSDAHILSDLTDLVWSEQIDVEIEPNDIHCGYEITTDAKNVIKDYLKTGEKLRAVKFLKEFTKNALTDDCMGLKDAKDYVDALHDQMKINGLL